MTQKDEPARWWDGAPRLVSYAACSVFTRVPCRSAKYFEMDNAVISGRSQWTEVFHGCDTLAHYLGLRNSGPTCPTHTAVRAAAVAGLRRNLVNASVASCAVSSLQAPPARQPASRPQVDVRFLPLSPSGTPVARRHAVARDCKTLLRSRFLRSRGLEKLLRHDAGYTDLALESRPLTGFYTTPRNGVIAIEAEFTEIFVAFCACIPATLSFSRCAIIA